MAFSSLSRSDRVLVGLWALLAVLVMVAGVREYEVLLRTGHPGRPLRFLVLPAAIGAFCLVTCFTIVKHLRLGDWLGGLGGALLTLFALLLVVMGTKDVGVLIPGVALAGFGVWNVFAAGLRS